MKKYKVYVGKLKRPAGNPKCVLKVGITSSSDAMDRINYRGSDEPYPITNYFTDNKIMISTEKVYTKEEAEAIERNIVNVIKGNEEYFHNWYEPDPISGATEMRKWNYDEFLLSRKLIEAVRNKI